VSEIYDNNILSEDALTILCTNHLSKICPYGAYGQEQPIFF